jgi:dihydroflavonol-4-reductase
MSPSRMHCADDASNGETRVTLVTGANGFVGSAVVRSLLKRGRRVRAFIESGTTEENLLDLAVERVHGNLLDYPSLLKALDGVDIVYHVAATFQFATSPLSNLEQYKTDCELFYRNNLVGTIQMLLAAQAANVSRVVYTSTMACIGVTPGRTLSDESMPFNIWWPVNDYMRSKAFAENAAHSFVSAGAPIVMVNPSWIVGPGDVFMTPVAQVVRDVMRQRQPALNPAGINIVDVDDVAEGHVLAEERGRIGHRYILAGENVDYTDLLDAISDAAGVPRLPSAPSVPSDFPRDFLFYDSCKARNELGWSSRPLKETVARAVRYVALQHEGATAS